MAEDSETGTEGAAEQLGRYQLLTPIAAGDYSTVYLARQRTMAGFSRLVALKRLKPLLARQSEYVDLLRQEACIGAGLNHANLVAAIDASDEPNECYVVLDYVEGDSLAGLLRRAGNQRHARFVVPLVVDALSGLHAAHTALGGDGAPMSLVHQAPRAEHILAGIDGMGRLADFGQARSPVLKQSRLRADRLRIGHMAPEQVLRPDDVDHRADLFILGVTLWEALTGQSLFETGSEEQTFQALLHRRVPPPSSVNPDAPRCLDSLCLAALEREPRDRYGSAAEMGRELRDAAINQALFATPQEVSQWVKALCGSELIARRRLSGGDTPSQQVQVDDGSYSGLFESHYTRPEPAAAGPFSDDALTAVHVELPPSEDAQEVPVFTDASDDAAGTSPLLHRDAAAALAPSAFVTKHGLGPVALGAPSKGIAVTLDENVFETALAAAEASADYPLDSTELPDFSESYPDMPTRVFDDEVSGALSFDENAVPTRVMPAPSSAEESDEESAEDVAPTLPPPPQKSRGAVEPTAWSRARAERPAPDPMEGDDTQAYGVHPSLVEQILDSRAPGAARPRTRTNSSFPPVHHLVREEGWASQPSRHDSVPRRMNLSTGPVGDVFAPGSSSAERSVVELAPTEMAREVPDMTPAPSEVSQTGSLPLPPEPEAFRHDPEVRTPIQIPPDTLTPPSQVHSMPPDFEEARLFRAGGSRWVTVGVVSALVVLGLLWLFEDADAVNPAAAGRPQGVDTQELVPPQPTAREGEQALDAVPAPSAGEPAAAPTLPRPEVPAAAATEKEPVQPEAAASRSDHAAQSDTPAPARGDSAAPAPERRERPPSQPRRRTRPAEAQPPSTPAPRPAPAQQPAPASRKHDWRDRGDVLPDNPF